MTQSREKKESNPLLKYINTVLLTLITGGITTVAGLLWKMNVTLTELSTKAQGWDRTSVQVQEHEKRLIILEQKK